MKLDQDGVTRICARVFDHEVSTQIVADQFDVTRRRVQQLAKQYRDAGDVFQRGCITIRDEMGISMLGHYQKYSGAYYYDAVQKGDKDLWLDIDRIAENLKDLHNEERDSYYLHDKLGGT